MHEEVFETVSFKTKSDWVAFRADRSRYRVGASEIGGLIGEGYASQSPYAMFVEKTTGQRIPSSQGFEMSIGTIAEPFVKTVYELKTRLKVYTDPCFTMRVSKAWPWMVATLDGWVKEGGKCCPVEFKFLGMHQAKEFRSDELPLKYTVQLQYQLAVTGWEYGYVVALIGTDLQIRKIHRHERLIQSLVRVSKEFVDACESGVPPEIDGETATTNALAFQYRDGGEDETCEPLPIDVCEEALELESLEKQASALEKQIVRIKNRVRACAGEATYAYAPDGTTWRWKKTKAGVRSLTRCAKPPRVVLKELAASLGESVEYEYDEFTDIGT